MSSSALGSRSAPAPRDGRSSSVSATLSSDSSTTASTVRQAAAGISWRSRLLQRLFNLIDRWLNPPDTSPSPPVAMCSPYDLPRVDLTTHDIDFLPYRRTVIGVRAVQIHAPFIVRTLEGLMT